MEDVNFQIGRADKFSDWAAVPLFLLGLAFLSNALGPFTRQTNLAAAVILIALFVVVILPRRFEARRLWFFIAGLAVILSIGFLLKSAYLLTPIAAFFLADAVVYWLGLTWFNKDNRESALVAILLLTGFLYAMLWAVYNYVPSIWYLAQEGSQLASHTIAAVFGQQQLFGATAFGVPILVLFIIFNFSAYLLSDSAGRDDRKSNDAKSHPFCRFLFAVLVVLIIHAFWTVLQEPAIRFLDKFQDTHHFSPLHLLILPFLLDLIPIYFYARTCQFGQIDYGLPKLRKMFAVSAAVVFFLTVVFLSWPDFTPPEKNKNNLFIFNRGYFNWEKPRFGQYGLTSAGMFGLLPDYLQALDYNVSVDSLLTAENLQSAHVLVVINLHRMLGTQEKQAIARFVENGSSLLVLGDHTGLGEMMPPLNDLLKFAGIQFNFDSAHYLKDGWNHTFELMPHAINSSVENEDDVGISVGASLAGSPLKAKPVITAKYGFSDGGNWLNKQQAYLGDRQYNPGELLGDIVLVAEGKLGKGKVLVFGDTSSLQNGTLARSFTFVDGMLCWLVASSDDNMRVVRTIIGALLLLASAGLFLQIVQNQKNMAVVMMAFGGLTLGFLLTSTLAARDRHQTVPAGQVAYIDMSHLERFEIYGDGGIWSLLYTLMRSDDLPFVHTRFSQPALQESKVFINIAPAKPLANEELQMVDEYLRQGGLVLWTVGYEEKEGSEDFLRQYGLAIDNVPLGPVPKDQTDRGLSFRKAWPIIFSDSTDVEVLCSGWGYPVIVAKRVGKGQLVVIGDSEFLLARNLEGATRVREENLRFVEYLVKSQRVVQK